MLCRKCYSGLRADGTCEKCEEYFARIRNQSDLERALSTAVSKRSRQVERTVSDD